MDEPALTGPGHDRRREQETRKKRRDEEERRGRGRREVREDGGTDVAAGAISAEAAGTSLDSTEFYWLGAAQTDVQILEVDRGDRESRYSTLQYITL